MDFILWFLNHIDEIGQVVASLVGASATIAAWTPTPKDDGVLAVLRKVIDLLGQNYGHAKNAGGK